MDLDKLVCVFSTKLANRRRVQIFLLIAQLLYYLVLDWQSMAIPTWHVGHMKTRHRSRLHDDVFQNLVQSMADMDAAVGIGGAIVQHILGAPLAGFLDLSVEPLVFPPNQHIRFPLRQIRLHGEIGPRQVERGFVIHIFSSYEAVSPQRSVGDRRRGFWRS